MDPLDKNLDSLFKMHQSLENLTDFPFTSIKEQERMVKKFSQSSKLVESLNRAEHIAQQFSSITEAQFGLVDSIFLASMNILDKQQNTLAESVCRSFGFDITDDLNTSGFLANLNQLTSNLKSVSVHENYVSMPEALIPDDFKYSEVDRGITNKSEESLPGSISVKKLSIFDAIAVVRD